VNVAVIHTGGGLDPNSELCPQSARHRPPAHTAPHFNVQIRVNVLRTHELGAQTVYTQHTGVSSAVVLIRCIGSVLGERPISNETFSRNDTTAFTAIIGATAGRR